MSDETSPIRVLHVDDEPDFADLAAEFLERENDRLEVATATSADEGLDRLTEESVDCIVSDYDMPGMDGIDFLEAVREDHPDLPFILFTGKGSEEIASEAVTAGATDYLQKAGGSDQYALLANRVVNATEKYFAEQEVQETQHRFRKLLEGAADYVHVIDPDGTIQYVSPSVEHVLGFDPDEVVGENALEYIHTDDRETARDAVRTVLEEPGAEATFEVRVRDDAGEWRWVEARARNLLDDPVIGGIIANARDISERKDSQAEADWRRTIIENLGEGVYVVDEDYRFQFVSHRVDDLQDLAEEDWAGEPLSILDETGINTEAEVRALKEAVDTILAGRREEVTVELQPALPEETEAVEVHLRPLRSPAGEEVALATTLDVTDRRRRTRQLETLHDVTRRMMVADTPEEVASIAAGAVSDTLGLRQAAVFRYDAEADALVPAATEVESDELRGEVPTFDRGEGIAWDVFESGEKAVVENLDDRAGAYDPSSPIESEFVLPLGEYGVLLAGTTTGREFDDETAGIADVLAANLTAALEQVERERELDEYERIVETMGDGVYAIDLDGEYIRLNEYFEELTGYDPKTIREEGPSLILDDEGIEAFETAIRTLLTTETEVETVETDLHTADGGAVPIETNLTLLPDEEGGYRGSVGVIRDISERRERERELERYETIVRAFPDEVYTLDPGGCFTSIIPPAGEGTTTSGYPPEELVGEHVSLVMDEEDIEKGEAIIQELLESESERTKSFEMDIVTREGDRIPNENHIALLPSDDGFRGTVGVLRNIADRKERERRLQRQNERLEEFASFVSHDLRNPLNVATGRLELARRECDSDHLDAVERAHGRMTDLIDALLTLAREGETPEEVQPLDLEALAEECWAHVDTGEATLVVETDRSVRAEETRLRQLVENLARNAVEHGADGGGAVTVRIGDLPDGFYVEDDGRGIPPEDRDEVFETGYSTADGTGLGLSIVKEIADAHGWDVRVTEGSEGGARFEFTGVES